MESAALWGAEHVELDQVATKAAGRRAAVAITRGRFAKAYGYVDPNEDVVAAVAGPRATLLVCADGHNGATASRRAVEEVLGVLGDDPPPGLSSDLWVALFSRVNEAVLSATIRGSEHPESRTVLLVALVHERTLSWGAIGDGAIVACAPGAERGRQLNQEAMRFVGYPMSQRVLRDLVQRGDTEIGETDWVVLVTDGLSEFVAPMRPAEIIPRILARAGAREGAAPEAAAAAIVDAACEAGAGDNVAVALIAPSQGPPRTGV